VTAYRVIMGICWAFWALVLTVSGIVELLARGYVAGLLCLISGLIAGWHDDRVRTGRAERLALITIPVPGHHSGARTIAPRRKRSYPMSTPHDQSQATFTPADQVPTQTFAGGPALAQPAAEYRWQGDGTQPRPAAPAGAGFTQAQPGDVQPDGTPQYTGNGFTAGERGQAPRGHGPVYNWFTTGDKTLSVDSEQGRALAPAIPDGWSVAGLICAFFVPLVGLILSIVAFADAKKNRRRVHGTAIGGFVVGALGCIAWTLYWVFVIVAFAALTNAVNSNPYGG
jgi:hypothetical protein